MKAKLILGGIFLSVLLGLTSPYWTADTYTVTVEERQQIVAGSYKVWTTDGQVFKIEDSLAYLNYSSANLYGKLKVGETFKVKASGVRFGPLSMFENIVSAEKN